MFTNNLDEIRNNVATSINFLAKYEDKLLKHTADIGWCSLECGGAALTTYKDATALFGDLFGREGWKRFTSGYSQSYNWQKNVDGVLVVISSAEKIPSMNDTPVPAKAFPLQLEDVKGTVVNVDVPESYSEASITRTAKMHHADDNEIPF